MIFWDTETTGLIKNPGLPLLRQPHIIEIGAVKETGEEFSQLINPGILIEPIITKVTGITNDDLKDCPRFSEVLPDFADFVLGTESWVAHNMSFDLGCLVFELRRLGKQDAFPFPPTQIDTIELAKPRYNGRFMKLNQLGEDLCDIPADQQNHRALDDAKLLMKVYEQLVYGE